MRLLLAILVLLAGLVPATAQHGEERRYFGDWLGACRTDGYCSATAYVNPNPAGVPVADYILRIGRHAEGTYWEISFTTIATTVRTGAPFTIHIDEQNQVFSMPSEVAPFGSINEFYFLGAGAQQVMDWIAPARSLRVDFADTGGTAYEAAFSLAGLTDALIWIDELQGRLGSERVAEAPPVGLAPAGELTIDAIPPALIAEDEARPDACDGFDMVDEPFYVHDLGGGKTLYLLPCTAGAYNRFYSVYIGDGSWFELQLFASPTYRAGWQAEEGVWLDRFDGETLQLSSYNMGRGMGDCGLRGLWQWTGASFVMLEYRMKPECDAAGEPGEFPLIYQNENPPDGLLR